MRPPPSIIWLEAAKRLAGKKSDAEFTIQQERVLEYLWHNFRGLYLGMPDEKHAKETILLISRDLSHNTSTAFKRERFDFLSQGFDLGNRTISGWSVPLGPVYVKVNRQENFSRQDRFRPITQAEKFVEVFGKSLEIPNCTDKDMLLGQILISAIFFGGLLDRRWLHPFLLSIQAGHYYQEGPVFWVDMVEKRKNTSVAPGDSVDNDSATNQLVRRLVPDHLTRLLIYRYHRLTGGSNKTQLYQDPWKCAQSYVKIAGFAASTSPRSLTELSNWAFSRYLTILPHSLVAYACGKLEAVSLPAGPWLRTISGMAIPVTKASEECQSENRVTKPGIVLNQHTQKSEQQRLLSDLLKLIRFNKKTAKGIRSRLKTSEKDIGRIKRQKARRIINVFLQHNKSRMSATLQLLLHWALRFLKEKVSHLERRRKQPIDPKSIDRYLSAIGYAMLYAAEDLPLHILDPQELETVYEQAVLRLKKNYYAMERLRQFHGFMQVYYNAEEMEWGDMLSDVGGPRSAVSANIITVEIYQAVLKSLGWGQPEITRWQRLHVIALIILFRCGLRPSELQALRLVDLQGVTKYEILVRNTKLNSIKTNNGIRRIPLSDMLQSDEFDVVFNYYQMRLEEDKQFGGGLFLTHPIHHDGFLSDKELFEPIRKQLKKVTLDETLRLYHLRHSLMTWTNFITLSDEEQCHIEFLGVTLVPEELAMSRKLFNNLYRNDNTGRKGLYMLAMLAGHSSPETTTHHYCHLIDLALAYHLTARSCCITISNHSVMNITGLKRSAAYDLLKVPKTLHPLHDTVANEAIKYGCELRHPLMASAQPLKDNVPSCKVTKIKPWEDAVASMQDNTLLSSLRKNRAEWDLAADVYEAVRAMDGRKIKSARKAIAYILENYNERYGGINIHLESTVKMIREFLKEVNIPGSHVIAIFHPAKRLTEQDTFEVHKNWGKVLGISPKLINRGENVPAKLRIRSMISLKITSKKATAKKSRAHKMSPGLMAAIMILSDQFTCSPSYILTPRTLTK